MTGPEHYRQAESLLIQAEGEFLDDSNDPLPRDEYASDAEWTDAMQFSHDMHEEGMRAAAWMTAQAQVHATLALAVATAHHTVPTSGVDRAAWRAVVGTEDEGDVTVGVW